MNKTGVLYIDSTMLNRKYFIKAFEAKYDIYTACCIEEAEVIMGGNEDNIDIILSDMRVPKTGIDTLRILHEKYPNKSKILSTEIIKKDDETYIKRMNIISNIIRKPWNIAVLNKILVNSCRGDISISEK